ncbi:hypothetical protein EG329_011571 [Mollisiaceae sp. DMI_Dod_QoI]|nr:hypothetical protein EG329_011571 [Helotiales sp. DMI_Dod_QoI]
MSEQDKTSNVVFKGWMGSDKDALQNGLKIGSFEPKKWKETDVDVKVTHCGVCFSDVCTLRSGWGPTLYPCCVGHEIVGTVVRVGNLVKRNISVGDRVGVGPVVYACSQRDCSECSRGMIAYCPRRVANYNGILPDGSKTYGGFANYCRVPGDAIIRIPKALDSVSAAPMLCAGITAFVPLKEFAEQSKRVGVIGIGGLGHFGILLAKAMGFEQVVAISRRENKRMDALNLGADDFIATEDEEDWDIKHAASLDLIVSTVSAADMPLNKYLGLLRSGGHFCIIGIPEAPLPPLDVFPLVERKVSIHFNDIGSVYETEKLLEFAVEKDVQPWVEERKMKDINKVLNELQEGNARYRYVMASDSSDFES